MKEDKKVKVKVYQLTKKDMKDITAAATQPLIVIGGLEVNPQRDVNAIWKRVAKRMKFRVDSVKLIRPYNKGKFTAIPTGRG
jgi:ribosomal protein S4